MSLSNAPDPAIRQAVVQQDLANVLHPIVQHKVLEAKQIVVTGAWIATAYIGLLASRAISDEGAFGSTAAAVTALFDDYESIGDRVVRMLAEEHRVADLGEMAAIGRRMHRQWVEAAFATRLPTRRGRARDEVLTSLLTATDVYVWKLLRRDFGLGRAAAERVVVRLAEGVLPNSEER